MHDFVADAAWLGAERFSISAKHNSNTFPTISLAKCQIWKRISQTNVDIFLRTRLNESSFVLSRELLTIGSVNLTSMWTLAQISSK